MTSTRRAFARRPVLVTAAVIGALAMIFPVAMATGLVDASRPSGGSLLPTVTVATGQPGSGDGQLPDGGVPPDRDDLAGVARLDPELLESVRRAAAAAADDDIRVLVTSGWRSRAYQQDLLDRAITTYGSREEALHWVADPRTSRHTTGDAVDLGATDAAYWMAQHGADFGLCQVFGNEIWHYELLVEPGGTCPAMRPDNAS